VRGSTGIRLEIKSASEVAKAKLAELTDVEEVEVLQESEGWLLLKIHTKSGTDIRDAVYEVVRREGWGLRELVRSRATLEDVFVELTQD
jgi:ABC-2 type transport system ATP-binding protein